MVTKPWATRLVDASGLQKIKSAVVAAEAKTSGEIVPMLVQRSTPMGHVFPLIASVFAALYFAFHIELLLEPWRGAHEFWSLVDLTIIIFFSWLLARLNSSQRLLTSFGDQDVQVMRRAQVEFYQAGLEKTEGATGVLIFVSLMERRAVVLADKNIARKLPPETWDDVVKRLLQGIGRGDTASGFADAIQLCGEHLAPHFPIKSDDRNELPDALIIKD